MIAGGVALGVVLLAIVGFYLYGLYQYNRVPKVAVAGLSPLGPGGSENILLVGNSCRTCLNGKQANAFGTASAQGNGGGSDVMMILHLDPATHQAVLLSLPRDSFVPMVGGGFNRLNAAFTGGRTQLVKTIEGDFGIPINHYMALNFDTFQQVVQALGGVDMYFPMPVKDAYSGLNVQRSGCHHLNGFQALAVVRARHLYYFSGGSWQPDGLGDISRIKRDHEFLRVVASTVKAKGLNPLRIDKLLSVILPNVKMDSSFAYGQIVDLALTFSSINPTALPSATLPVYLSNQSIYSNGYDFGSVVFPVQPADTTTIANDVGIQPPPIRRGTTVQVLNGSGMYNQATGIASQISALGEKITQVGDTSVASAPAETVVYYAPGQIGQAQALQAHLIGSVVMAPANLPAGTDLRVVTGSYLSVKAPTPPSSGGGSSPGAGAGAPSGTGSSLALGTIAPTSPLPPWDPRGCPAGMPVTPAN